MKPPTHKGKSSNGSSNGKSVVGARNRAALSGMNPGYEAQQAADAAQAKQYADLMASMDKMGSSPVKKAPTYQPSGFGGYTAPAALPKRRVNMGGQASAV